MRLSSRISRPNRPESTPRSPRRTPPHVCARLRLLLPLALLGLGLGVFAAGPVAAQDASEERPVTTAADAPTLQLGIAPDAPSAPDVALAPGPFGRRLLRLPFLPLDARIMFVLDGSNSQDGLLNLEMKKAARRMLRLLDLRNNANVEVGVVQFDKSARLGCRLMQDDRRLVGCINQVRNRLGTNIVDGLRKAYQEILRNREHPGVPADQAELVVLFSDGLHRGHCDDVTDEAHSIKANGIRVIAVAVGPRADTECLADVVTTRVDLYQIATHVRLGE